jgi:hypothetical protein
MISIGFAAAFHPVTSLPRVPALSPLASLRPQPTHNRARSHWPQNMKIGRHRRYGRLHPSSKTNLHFRAQTRVVNVGGAKLRGLQSSFARQFPSYDQAIFIQVDSGRLRSFARGPASNITEPTAKLHETVPRNESRPSEQFSSSAMNCTNDSQSIVVTSPGP